MICTGESAPVWPEKHPSATLDYAIDFEFACARQWDKWTDYSAGQRIRVFIPGSASGYEFEVSIAGRTAGRQPVWWPTSLGATVVSGSVTFTARAISSASLLRTISGTPAWSADTGVTVSSVSVSGLKAIAKIAGGTDEQDYAVTVTAIGSDGLVMVETAILPVRIPVRRCG